MARHAEGKRFDTLDEGPLTIETLKSSGVRLFVTAIHCLDKYNDEMSKMHFQQNYDYAMKIIENITRVRGMKDISQIRENRN
jgi:hypothetical protein